MQTQFVGRLSVHYCFVAPRGSREATFHECDAIDVCELPVPTSDEDGRRLTGEDVGMCSFDRAEVDVAIEDDAVRRAHYEGKVRNLLDEKRTVPGFEAQTGVVIATESHQSRGVGAGHVRGKGGLSAPGARDRSES